MQRPTPTSLRRASLVWLLAALAVLPRCETMLGIGPAEAWDGAPYDSSLGPGDVADGGATTEGATDAGSTGLEDRGPSGDAVDEVDSSAPAGPQVLAFDQQGAWDLRVHDGQVIWTNLILGQVMSVPVGGGVPTTLADQVTSPFSLAVDSTSVYVTEFFQSAWVVRVPLDGGPSQNLAWGANPYGVAVDSTAVYWGSNSPNGALLRQPLDGGRPTLISQSGPGAIAIDDASVYWTTQTNVLEAPLTGGPVATLASGSPYWIAVRAGQVYFSECLAAGAIRRVPADGGPSVTLAAGLNFPSVIALDETSVYWTDPGSDAGFGSVMKAALDGGSPVTLATGQDAPHGIAVDGTSVYWASYGDSRVMKLSKTP